MDFEFSERELIPVWEEKPEVYYDPVILELELNQIKNEFAELKYQYSELEAENKLLKTEILTKEKEKTELKNLYKENSIKLPNCQAKVLELNKIIIKLNADNKNLLMANSISKEKRLEKNNTKCKFEKGQELKVKLQIKDEYDKIKAKNDELKIENKAFKAQISTHSDEIRSKDILAIGLARNNKILDTIYFTNQHILQIKLKDSEKQVILLEKKIKAINKECSGSILRYTSLLNENNTLRSKLNDADDLATAVDELKANERGLYRQMNMFKRLILKEQLENKKLIEIAQQLEKQKTKYIYTGEDITIIKRKLEECMKQNLDLSKKFSNLDCPFYQSKYGKIEDNEPVIKCGSIKERHYKGKIFALEHVIKTLHLKYESQEKKQLQYRGVVIKSMYDAKKAETKEKAARKLLEEQKYQIIYDKIEVLAKDSKIQKLEIQKENCDNQYTLRANNILEDVEEKDEELRNKTEESEKLKKILKVQLDNNLKCQKSRQSEANKIKSTIEEFQKKIHYMEEELNNAKQKNDKLTNAFEEFKTQNEFNYKIQTRNINDAKSEIVKLSIQNKALKFENKCLSKFKEDNKLLQSRLITEERNLAYLQKKFDKLYYEKERKIHSMKIFK
ncbi:hypothetical protein ACI65C_003245 [Semiaphis heraclei]